MAANRPILLDSNIVIYTGLTPYKAIRKWLKSKTYLVSAITHLEVLGYYQLTSKDKEYFEAFFKKVKMIPVQAEIIQKAIELRQDKIMSLGDAIIAATALSRNLPLLTANARDFHHIKELELIGLETIENF